MLCLPVFKGELVVVEVRLRVRLRAPVSLLRMAGTNSIPNPVLTQAHASTFHL